MGYPNALRRYVATMVDVAVVWSGIALISRLYVAMRSDVLAFSLSGLLVLSYEPLLTVYASTIGQAAMRFKVRTVDGLNRISVGQAYGRFIVKYLLGIISFMTMPARSDRRAVHDLAAETIVIEASSSTPDKR
jgi:uncharacterized RDD family membrane protein YckC